MHLSCFNSMSLHGQSSIESLDLGASTYDTPRSIIALYTLVLSHKKILGIYQTHVVARGVRIGTCVPRSTLGVRRIYNGLHCEEARYHQSSLTLTWNQRFSRNDGTTLYERATFVRTLGEGPQGYDHAIESARWPAGIEAYNGEVVSDVTLASHNDECRLCLAMQGNLSDVTTSDKALLDDVLLVNAVYENTSDTIMEPRSIVATDVHYSRYLWRSGPFGSLSEPNTLLPACRSHTTK